VAHRTGVRRGVRRPGSRLASGFADDEPLLWLDCKDGIMAFMARTAIRIVAEELRSVGLTSATLFTPDPERS